MLNGPESHQEFTPDLSVVGSNIKALFVWDTSGKNWYVPDSELRKIVAQAGKYVSDPDRVSQKRV